MNKTHEKISHQKYQLKQRAIVYEQNLNAKLYIENKFTYKTKQLKINS